MGVFHVKHTFPNFPEYVLNRSKYHPWETPVPPSWKTSLTSSEALPLI